MISLVSFLLLDYVSLFLPHLLPPVPSHIITWLLPFLHQNLHFVLVDQVLFMFPLHLFHHCNFLFTNPVTVHLFERNILHFFHYPLPLPRIKDLISVFFRPKVRLVRQLINLSFDSLFLFVSHNLLSNVVFKVWDRLPSLFFFSLHNNSFLLHVNAVLPNILFVFYFARGHFLFIPYACFISRRLNDRVMVLNYAGVIDRSDVGAVLQPFV